MNNLTILAYFYSIGLLIISLIVMGITLPAVIREGNVKNGLRNYRKIFLISGSSIFALAVAAVVILFSRFFLPLETYRAFGAIVLMVFATIVLVIVIANFQIYHYQFTVKQKKLHSDMDDVEHGRSKIVNISVKDRK